MIYKISNQNYLSKRYLPKWATFDFTLICLPLICLLFLCTNPTLNGVAASPLIINGSTPEDTDEPTCSEIELRDYVEKAKKSIASKWQPIKGLEDREVVVVFMIKKNGEIEGEEIIKESGSQAVDRSAIAALKIASPLPPLPKGAPDFIQIRYVFSWRVTRK